MTNTSIIAESVVPFPVTMTIKEQAGKRYQMMVNETCFNFYDGEQVYMHVDNKQLGLIVAKEQQNPSRVKTYLKTLVNRWW